MEVSLVTSNSGKVKELERILGRKLKVVPLDVEEIQAVEVSRVVREKAKRAYEALRRPLVVEDTGLYLDALNGFPGGLVKMLLERIGTAGICKMLDSFKDRGACAETCLCFYDGKSCKVFSGRAYGTITERPIRGIAPFGWNSIFRPRGYSKTYSEMTIPEKNRISMRGKAALKLKRALNSSRNRRFG